MKRKFNFVNITDGANNELVDVNHTTIFSYYNSNVAVE